jgi:hypothetical protein
MNWHFTDAGAPVLPFHHRFMPLVWSDHSTADNVIGEVPGAKRLYFLGGPLPGAGNGGSCGTADQWLNGVGPPPWPAREVNEFDLPSCCNAPALQQPVGTGQVTIVPVPGGGSFALTPVGPYLAYPASTTGGNYYALPVAATAPPPAPQTSTWLLQAGGPVQSVPVIYNPLGLFQYDPTTSIGTWYNSASSPVFPGATVQLASP